jgi:hypothetical protein
MLRNSMFSPYQSLLTIPIFITADLAGDSGEKCVNSTSRSSIHPYQGSCYTVSGLLLPAPGSVGRRRLMWSCNKAKVGTELQNALIRCVVGDFYHKGLKYTDTMRCIDCFILEVFKT